MGASKYIDRIDMTSKLQTSTIGDKGKFEEFPVYLFEKDFIMVHTKMNVSSQNHIFKIHKS